MIVGGKIEMLEKILDKIGHLAELAIIFVRSIGVSSKWSQPARDSYKSVRSQIYKIWLSISFERVGLKWSRVGLNFSLLGSDDAAKCKFQKFLYAFNGWKHV